MTNTSIRSAALGGILSFALLSPTDAAAQVTYRACFIPQVGAMYLLDLPGLPTACLSTDHQEITWSEEAVLAPGSVATTDIADGAIDEAKLADEAVTTAKIAGDAVTPDEIADDAVTASAILDGTVATAELADAAVNGLKLAGNAVSSTHIVDGAVGSTEIASNAIENSHLQANSVTSANIAPNSITAADLATNSVGGAALNVLYQRNSLATTVPVGGGRTFSLTCPVPREVVTAGWQSTVPVEVFGSYPASPTRWIIRLRHQFGTTQPVTLWYICADLF